MMKRRKGFTLIELLVVVAIIAVLSAVGLSLFTNAQRKARDARRREDLKQIQNAAEQYYLTNGSYPTTTAFLATFISGGVLPTDPRSGATSYTYVLAATTYTISADLELLADGGVGTWTGAETNLSVTQLQ